jgi:hypothetical protein
MECSFDWRPLRLLWWLLEDKRVSLEPVRRLWSEMDLRRLQIESSIDFSEEAVVTSFLLSEGLSDLKVICSKLNLFRELTISFS